MKSSKQGWPDDEFRDRLSKLVAAAGSAGVHRGDIARVLESEAESVRRLAAINASLNLVPKTTSGNVPAGVGSRLAQMIRGQ